MRPKSGVVSLVVLAGGVAGWLVACATVSVVPLDGPETDDATTEAATAADAPVTTDAADAADSAEAATEADADASDLDSATNDADADSGD